MILSIFYHEIDNECPKEIYLNKYVRDKVCGSSEPKKWRDLGVELLNNDDDIKALDGLICNMDEKECCSKMFKFWRERQPLATWRQLIDALYVVKLNRIADDVEKLLIPKEQMQVSTNQHDGEQAQTLLFNHQPNQEGKLHDRYRNYSKVGGH